MKVLSICGSPIKKGNTYTFIERAVEALDRTAHEIEIVELARAKVSDCIHCNWCLKNEDPERICVQKDDAEPILAKIKDADVLVLASPAYYGRMSGRMASLLDRTRPLIFSKPHRGCMRDKPGVALTVGWGRNSGSETTLLSLIWSFMVLEMIPVSHHHSGAIFGGVGISNPILVNADRDDRQAVASDVVGILAAQQAVNRAVDLCGRIRRKS